MPERGLGSAWIMIGFTAFAGGILVAFMALFW
jgi:hypothetical protein